MQCRIGEGIFVETAASAHRGESRKDYNVKKHASTQSQHRAEGESIRIQVYKESVNRAYCVNNVCTIIIRMTKGSRRLEKVLLWDTHTCFAKCAVQTIVNESMFA